MTFSIAGIILSGAIGFFLGFNYGLSGLILAGALGIFIGMLSVYLDERF